ncbi:hypothetical protein [Cyanobacterium aponinum]|uniref:Uncharacterized protein n=1 Tax=Cyanobacterium aponinum (strain PCC 10605) TaxID=755178 RepID=K9ZA42_CYAAP|nr:hypothetical protein [Cyanobacterium aponinum]AFZ55587.1 hypothetical protein Cyan10605_3554 [Cyanobacterium aponinum PCC 10605]
MLNIPHHKVRNQNSEVRTNSNKSKLEELIELRKKVNQLEQLIQEIMPLAISEAIDIMGNEETVNGKNVVYSQKNKGKITVTFRKQYPTIKDNTTLKRLDEDIKAELQLLTQKHSSQLSNLDTQLAELDNTIAQLETEKEKLMTNKRLINLKTRFNTERENGMELVPNLSVYIDK